jgi:hypothetical protein
VRCYLDFLNLGKVILDKVIIGMAYGRYLEDMWLKKSRGLSGAQKFLVWKNDENYVYLGQVQLIHSFKRFERWLSM